MRHRRRGQRPTEATRASSHPDIGAPVCPARPACPIAPADPAASPPAAAAAPIDSPGDGGSSAPDTQAVRTLLPPSVWMGSLGRRFLPVAWMVTLGRRRLPPRLMLLTFVLLLFIGPYIIKHKSGGKETNCEWGKPCVYQDTVDIRILVLTYNRPESVHKCLNATKYLQMDGDTAALEIWIDRAALDGSVDEKTLSVARDFSWEQGRVRVHVQDKPAGLHGQWINTWRRRAGTRELALYLEDDVDVSPYGYRWLRAAWERYGADPQLAGIVLQDEYIITAAGRSKGVTFPRPRDDPLFMYPILMPWGFSPSPRVWEQFQDWYHGKRVSDPSFLPYLPQAGLYNSWFEDMVRENRTSSMWTMWFNYYLHLKQLYVIYGNLPVYSGRNGTKLVVHRREKGLHFVSRTRNTSHGLLLNNWNKSYIMWPKKIKRYNYDGSFKT